MSNNYFEKVKIARKQQGITLKGLSDKSGVSVGHLSEFENGKTTLGGEKLVSVCRILGIELNGVDTGAPPMFTSELAENIEKPVTPLAMRLDKLSPVHGLLGNTRPIPIISWAQAGTNGFFEDCYPVGYGGIGTINWFADLRDDNAYALQIRGDSMLKRYYPGDYVIVSPSAGVSVGDFAIVKLVDGQVLCKEVTARNSHFILSSVNPAYEDVTVAKEDVVFVHKIIGSKSGLVCANVGSKPTFSANKNKGL